MRQLRTLFLLIFFVKVCKVQFAEKCGHPISARAIGKIVGGFDIGYFKYPWFVVFMKGDEQYCAGTLISIRHVVTAAHCYKSSLAAANAGQLKLEDVFSLRFGVYNNCATENTQKVFKAAKVYVHELYKKNDPYYDIALVKVTKNVDGFEPCCLPKKPMYSKTRPREAYIQGVGDQEYNSNVQTCTVHEARVLIYSDEVCRKMLQNAEDDGAALKHAFCAGYLNGGIDACQGDSGGPLIILGADSRFVLLGITSFGFECAKKDVLGLYTDASHFLAWMKSKIQKQGNTTTIPPAPSGDDDNTTDIAPPGGSVDWGQYPVTTWIPSTITFVPYQTPYPYDTPPENPPSPPQYHPQRPIIIIINARNKKRMEKLKLLRNKHIKNHITKRTKKKNNNGK